ncbi:hypothetical protein BJX63DRAFT_410923 [Aspergillus granulosus]|uniref:Uncharacterized protein n=1 Tax=Aspergillus granulosus TaxID=176169 RepID=A0ABR4GZ84_9EURO
MEAADLKLTVPDVHLLTEPYDQVEAPPIIGCIAIAVPTLSLPIPASNIPQITVRLVRCVRLNKFDSTTKRQKEAKRYTNRFWKQTSPVRQTSPNPPRISPVQRQILVRYDICHTPDEIDRNADEELVWLKYNLHFPVPSDLQGTLNTIGGGIYYAIEATISTGPQPSDQRRLQVSQPFKIHHCTQPKTISHLRRYPGDLVTTELHITPSSVRKGISYSLEWLAFSTVTQGARPSEVKYVVAKELHWSIDESVKCLVLGRGNTTYSQQYTRRLSEGRLKGRWAASGGSHKGSDAICIPLKINVPPDTTNLSSYRDHHSTDALENCTELLAVTVDHRLHLEVITGEDTFHREAGDLLDRRYPVKSYKATFPLLVRKLVSEDLPSPAGVGVSPPRYEEPYVMPPVYGT